MPYMPLNKVKREFPFNNPKNSKFLYTLKNSRLIKMKFYEKLFKVFSLNSFNKANYIGQLYVLKKAFFYGFPLFDILTIMSLDSQKV